MGSNAKFLFDTEFGGVVQSSKKEEQVPEQAPLLYTEEDKAQFCAEAQQIGFSNGQQEALQSIEASSTEILNGLAGQLQNITQTHGETLDNIRCEAASLAFTIAKKLAPALISRQPEAEVLKMVENCLADLHDEPRIVVRASEPVCDIVTEQVNKLIAASGFQGNIIVLPDDTKQGSDCRVEWADGGAERSISDTNEQVETVIQRFISACHETGKP
jgi:flagellar assembly protein FliH